MSNKESLQKLKSVSDTLKKTDTGVTFLKQLYLDPATLSPAQIMNVLTMAGVEIPKDAIVTAKLAQTLMTGGAFTVGDVYNAVDLIEKAPITSIDMVQLKLGVQILRGTGLLENQDVMSTVSIGLNSARIISSVGTDVTAWMALASDVANIYGSMKGNASRRAWDEIKAKYSADITKQSKAIVKHAEQYEKGEVSLYGFIASVAHESPDHWPQLLGDNSPIAQMFPGLRMVPQVTRTIHGKGVDEKSMHDPFGNKIILSRVTAHESYSYDSFERMNKEQAAAFVFEQMVKPWVMNYAMANAEIISRGNMAMSDVAILSYLINPNGMISPTDDYVGFLVGARLTPFDLDDPIMYDIANEEIEERYSGQVITFTEQAITSGLTAANRAFGQYHYEKDLLRRNVTKTIKTGNIEDLMSSTSIKNRLQKYMQFERLSFETPNGPFAESSAWRELNNYFATMSMIHEFRTDSYLSNTKFAQDLMPFFPSVDVFDEKFKYIKNLSLIRNIERMAIIEVANTLGVDASKVRKITGRSAEEHDRYEIIGGY